MIIIITIIIMDNHQKQTQEMQMLVQEYIQSMSEKERKAYEIAKDHLGMSYQEEKSIAFLNYCKTKDALLGISKQ